MVSLSLTTAYYLCKEQLVCILTIIASNYSTPLAWRKEQPLSVVADTKEKSCTHKSTIKQRVELTTSW